MSTGKRVGRNVVKPLVVALALALPGTAAFAASMDDVVKTRADQNIDEQYGRDSVYAFSRDAKPLKPEQQGAHDMGFIGDAFHKTTGSVAGAWHKTTALFTGDGKDDGKSYSANRYQYEPERYGRAGGYAGSDRVEVIAGKWDGTATANADTVKTGEELDNAAAAGTSTTMPAESPSSALESPDRTSTPQEPSAAVDYTPVPPTVEEPNSAIRDESAATMTAPAAEEQTVVTEQPVMEPSNSTAATDELPPRPLDQSPTANGDVVRTSPLPPSDNGRADSANTQDDSSAQTR
jgi:hypothetical protein